MGREILASPGPAGRVEWLERKSGRIQGIAELGIMTLPVLGRV